MFDNRWVRTGALVALACLATLLLFTAATFAQSVTPPPGVPFAVWPLLLAVLQWVVGFVLKKAPKVVNGVIPWVTLLLSVLGYAVVPPQAHAMGRELLGPFATLPNVMLMALQTAVVTGLHEWLLNGVVKPLLGKSATSTSYL